MERIGKTQTGYEVWIADAIHEQIEKHHALALEMALFAESARFGRSKEREYTFEVNHQRYIAKKIDGIIYVTYPR